MGISVAPFDGETAGALLKYAETALSQAKCHGRNTVRFYQRENLNGAINRVNLEADMRDGLRQGEFCLYFQPQVSLMSGKLIGVEALVRWQHPRLGMIPPDEFISIAEETGFIQTLGQ